MCSIKYCQTTSKTCTVLPTWIQYFKRKKEALLWTVYWITQTVLMHATLCFVWLTFLIGICSVLFIIFPSWKNNLLMIIWRSLTSKTKLQEWMPSSPSCWSRRSSCVLTGLSPKAVSWTTATRFSTSCGSAMWCCAGSCCTLPPSAGWVLTATGGVKLCETR